MKPDPQLSFWQQSNLDAVRASQQAAKSHFTVLPNKASPLVPAGYSLCQLVETEIADGLPIHEFKPLICGLSQADAFCPTQAGRGLPNRGGTLMELIDLGTVVATCQLCRCTDEDCSGCIERTGRPCSWVFPGLCSACCEALLALGLEDEEDEEL